jgi:hypothetical protein
MTDRERLALQKETVLQAARTLISEFSTMPVRWDQYRSGAYQAFHDLRDALIQHDVLSKTPESPSTPSPDVLTESALDAAVATLLEHKGINIVNSLLKQSALADFIDRRVRTMKRAVLCTCGILERGSESVPDPQTSLRHSILCPHSIVRDVP